MSGPAPTRVDVHVGDVSGSQLVIGDHTVVQTPDGARITIVPTGQGPVARLRPVPFARVPPLRMPLLGRVAEMALTAQVTAQAPLQLFGPEGVGKTALLKTAAHAPVTATEGILFVAARRRNLDEILLALYDQSWECDTPFVPSPAQVGGYLADRDALVILDDCALDRDDLDALLDTVPYCRFLVGSAERTLLAFGRAQELGGLDEATGLALLERELARGLEPAERAPAETVIRRVDGHPQRLIEAAALVNDGLIDLAGLAGVSTGTSERLNADGLSSAQRRLLSVLGLLDGAALGGHIAADAAGIPGGEQLLGQLEARGWVKSASPRYRLVRPLPEGSLPNGDDPTHRLLVNLTEFASASRVGPAEVREEAEAIEAVLTRAVAERRHEDAARLARASESKLARSGAWVSWERVLRSGLRATRATGDRAGQAHMLHQLGSLGVVVGQDRGAAIEALRQALRLREQDGNASGAALTRFNLGQVIGEGGPPGNGNGEPPRPGPRRPRRGFFLFGLVMIVVLIGAVAALNSSGSDNATTVNVTGAPANLGPVTSKSSATTTSHSPSSSATTTSHSSSSPGSSTTSTPPPAPLARIAIASPTDGRSYTQGSQVPARYQCFAAVSCTGPVFSGQPFDTSTTGSHSFPVTAKNRDGRSSTTTVTYTVTAADTTPPTITVNSPKERGDYSQGSVQVADYTCSDSGGSGQPTCNGTVPSGQPFDTATLGAHSFTVDSTDKAGNHSSQTVTYTVSPALQ